VATYTGSRTAAYQQQSILTAPPERLVVMLYDGCLRFLHQAAYAMRDDKPREADARLKRAEAIIDELQVTLDHKRGGEIASRLQGIYVFCRRHLLDARRANDADMVDKVAELLGELREAWAEIAGSAAAQPVA
jgi:flagellar protein FliS